MLGSSSNALCGRAELVIEEVVTNLLAGGLLLTKIYRLLSHEVKGWIDVDVKFISNYLSFTVRLSKIQTFWTPGTSSHLGSFPECDPSLLLSTPISPNTHPSQTTYNGRSV
jgi:hypothetical protein